MYLNKESLEIKNTFDERHILTVRQLAEYCQLSEITIRRALKTGELIGLKFGNTWRIEWQKARNWIDSKIKE